MIKSALALVLLSVLTGLLAWWQVQLPTTPGSSKNSGDEWKLPTLPEVEKIRASYLKLLTLNPWKANTPPPKPVAEVKTAQTLTTASLSPSKQAEWQLVGIIQQGQQRFALLLDKATKVTHYSLRSALPNGDILVNIREDSIEVLKQGKVELVNLYQ